MGKYFRSALASVARWTYLAGWEINAPVERDQEILMKKDQLYIEKRPQGDFAVRKADAQRASAVLPTQGAAIERAKELNPNGKPLVERVRNTTAGGRDKWRKA